MSAYYYMHPVLSTGRTYFFYFFYFPLFYDKNMHFL